VALIIGIGKYEHLPQLANPAPDAAALDEALRRLNFEVTSVLDADKDTLEDRLHAFGDKATEADVALILFAGYGLQVNGRGVMLAADAYLQHVRDLAHDAIPLDLFLTSLADVRQLGIILVDDYGDDRITERLTRAEPGAGVSSRLELTGEEPEGMLVAICNRTGPSNASAGHSALVDALLQQLNTPRLDLAELADRVRQTTGGRQHVIVSGEPSDLSRAGASSP